MSELGQDMDVCVRHGFLVCQVGVVTAVHAAQGCGENLCVNTSEGLGPVPGITGGTT